MHTCTLTLTLINMRTLTRVPVLTRCITLTIAPNCRGSYCCCYGDTSVTLVCSATLTRTRTLTVSLTGTHTITIT